MTKTCGRNIHIQAMSSRSSPRNMKCGSFSTETAKSICQPIHIRAVANFPHHFYRIFPERHLPRPAPFYQAFRDEEGLCATYRRPGAATDPQLHQAAASSDPSVLAR